MEDEAVYEIAGITVTVNRVTAEYTIQTGRANFTGQLVMRERTLLDSQGNSTGVPLPDALELQLNVISLVASFMKAVADSGLLPRSDSIIIQSAADDLSNAVKAVEMGGSLTDAKSAVSGALEIMFDEIGERAGQMITAAMLGAAGLTATTITGPGAIAGAGLSFLAGYLFAESFPSEALADVTTNIIFFSLSETADAVHRIEQDMNRSISDFAIDVYDQILDQIYEGMPAGVRPMSSLEVVRPDSNLDAVFGDFRFNAADLSAATASLAVNLSIDAAQDVGGGLGPLRFLSIEGVFGSIHADSLIGNFADNTLRGSAGDDYIDGGAGFDFADYSDHFAQERSDGVRIDLRQSVQANGWSGTDTLVSIEGVRGSNLDDVLIGNDDGNTLIGGRGGDTIYGMGGDDLIIAHAVTYHRNGERDFVDGGEGIDTLSFAAETLSQGMNVTANLQTGTARFGDARFGVTIQVTSIENLIGGNGNDVFTGNDAANNLRGGGGHDTINGGAGDDYIDGGAGFDRLDGGAGIDTVSYLSSADAVDVTINQHGPGDWLVTGFENLMGSLNNDTLRGDTSNNEIYGANGDDVIWGGGGNDRLFGGEGIDTLAVSGLASDYLITSDGDGFLITDQVGSRDGSAWVSDIEQIRFGDGTVVDFAAALSGFASESEPAYRPSSELSPEAALDWSVGRDDGAGGIV